MFHSLRLLFYRDTYIVCLANSATSIMAGFVIFSAIGYMAHIHNLPVDDIATDGKFVFIFPVISVSAAVNLVLLCPCAFQGLSGLVEPLLLSGLCTAKNPNLVLRPEDRKGSLLSFLCALCWCALMIDGNLMLWVFPNPN